MSPPVAARPLTAKQPLSPPQTPQSSTSALPLGTPAQSAQELLSPPQTPHSSFSNVEPQVLSQPDGPASPQPQPKSTLPSQSHWPSAMPVPPQIPHSSISAVPPHSPAQSASSQAGTSSGDGVVEAISAPSAPDTIRSLMLIILPSAVGSNVIETRLPLPASKELPDKLKPTTTPVSAPKVTISKSAVAPVRVTPLISN